MAQERLQKILAAHGFGSRRKSEEVITAGRVTVNGKAAEIGQKADLSVDDIQVDGKSLKDGGIFLYYILNKPVGVETTNLGEDTLFKAPLSYRINSMKQKELGVDARKNRRTVRDLIPQQLRGKIFPVGRLDKDSEGLLLLTNDGLLGQRLMHPRFHHEKEYEVRVDRQITNGALQQLKKGLFLDGSPTKQTRVERLAEGLFRIMLTEGRNRQIRRMCEKLGYRVTGLKRVRIASLTDDSLRSGSMRPLRPEEILALRRTLGIEKAGG